jgi:hypothetical protein
MELDMSDSIANEFVTMSVELEAELIEARQHLVETETTAAEAVAARVASEAARDALRAAVEPFGNSIGSALANQLADKTRALHAATGNVTRTAAIADGARRRVADLEISIGQLAFLIAPPTPADELVAVVA